MKYGMTQEQYHLLQELVIKPLKKIDMQVFLFGSRASGKHHSHSDVDLLFRSMKEAKLPAGEISKIKEAIEESRFPFTVDLVDEKDLAISYRDSVLAEMIEL